MSFFTAHQLGHERAEGFTFQDVSFAIKRGGGVLLVGDNGAGKSTCLNVLAGLMPASVGSYALQVNESSPVQHSDMHTHRAYLGDALGLHPALTVCEHLRWGINKVVSDQACNELLKSAKLYKKLHTRLNTLSAGQKKRVALCRVILSQKPLWLLDEPFAHLDDAGVAWFSERLNTHLSNNGAVVLSAHQPPAALSTLSLTKIVL